MKCRSYLLCIILFLHLWTGWGCAGVIPFDPVVVSVPNVPRQDLVRLLGGSEGKECWPVFAEPGGQPGVLVLRFEEPLSAPRVRLRLRFQIIPPAAFFRAFQVKVTTDAIPGLGGRWTPAFPMWARSSEGMLSREADGVRHTGAAERPEFKVDLALPFDGVTGLRIEVTSTGSEDGPKPAVLADLGLERLDFASTNVAFGCPVVSSHPLPSEFHPSQLTDGLMETESRLPAEASRKTFFYEIDFKHQRHLDHLVFRTHAKDIGASNLFGVMLRLYEQRPDKGTAHAWEHQYLGSSPESGTGLEVVRMSDGKGVGRGRYLRIYNVREIPFPPQMAEVEAYEVLVPRGLTVRSNGQDLPAGEVLRLPANASWFTFAVQYPALQDSVSLGCRWRIQGFHDNWLDIPPKALVEGLCPPPGKYELQAQIRHSDMLWNEAALHLPVIVPTPFWSRLSIRLVTGMLAAGGAAFFGWKVSRFTAVRRMAELEHREQLSAERSRIARDMHDAVGSQLTQLAIRHEIVAEELGLSTEARSKLRALTDTARASVNALDAVVWAINPANDSLAQMSGYLSEVAHRYLTELGIVCRQDVQIDWPEIQVASHIRHQIYLAFYEALQNVAKHARATEVMITIRLEDQAFVVKVADDGVGLPTVTSGVAKDGLANMKSRLGLVGGVCQVVSGRDQGTIVELKISLPV